MLSSRKAVKWLFGMAVAGALGFGATGAAASVARMDCSHPFALRETQDIRRLAVTKGRFEVVRALDRSMARSARRRTLRAGADAVRRPVGALLRRMRGSR